MTLYMASFKDGLVHRGVGEDDDDDNDDDGWRGGSCRIM